MNQYLRCIIKHAKATQISVKDFVDLEYKNNSSTDLTKEDIKNLYTIVKKNNEISINAVIKLFLKG